jgi:hypothetical protein
MAETKVSKGRTVGGDSVGLRYHMHDRASSFRFRLAGALAGDNVTELEQCWIAASSTLGNRAFVVDLSELNAVDSVGRELLSEWHRQGAEFIATSPHSRLLAESITGLVIPPASPDRAPYRGWLSCRITQALLFIVASLMVPITAWSAQPSPAPKLLLARYTTALAQTSSGLEWRGMSSDPSAEVMPASLTDVSAANYKFRYVNTIGTGRRLTYVFQITPRRRQVGLIQGELWIDVSTGIPVRMAGRMVKSPSASQRRIDVIQDTDIREGRAYLRITKVEIDTVPAGRAELTIIEHPRVFLSDGQTAGIGLGAELNR